MKKANRNKAANTLVESVCLVRYVLSQKISIYAAHTAYFMVLSIFPSLVLTLSILRYTGLQVETLAGLLEGVVPDVLMPTVKRLILSTYRNSSATLVSISALTALWSSSRGIYGLLIGLNSIYGVSESRGYLRTRFISMVYTFLFLVVMLLTLLLHVFGNAILKLLPPANSTLFIIISDIIQSRFVSLFILQTALFTAIFMVFPNDRNSFKGSIPSAVLASLGWLLFTKLYSVYVSHVTIYTTIYGSVYVVALGMLWLYCCMFIVFSGGALNSYLNHRKIWEIPHCLTPVHNKPVK